MVPTQAPHASTEELSSEAAVAAHSESFRQRFLVVVTGAGLIALLAAIVVTALVPELEHVALGLTPAGLAIAATLVFARRGSIRAASHGFLAVGVAAITYASAAQPLPTSISGSIVGYTLIGVMAAFLVERSHAIAYLVACVLGVGVVTMRVLEAAVVTPDIAWSAAASGAVMLVLAEVCLLAFAAHHERGLDLLQSRVRDIERVMESAAEIADGNLGVEVEGEGGASVSVRRMLESLRQVVSQIRRDVNEVNSAAGQIATMARRQQAAAVGQLTAAEEVGATLQALRTASERVASSSDEVFASITDTAASNRHGVELLGELAVQAQRIDEVAKMIHEVATKSEVLALNAALEGIHAGEQGRGFSMVAAEMQNLASRVADLAGDVQKLTRDIDEATDGVIATTHEGAARSTKATEMSRQIRDVSRRQLESAGQAEVAMAEVTRSSSETSLSSQETLEATAALEGISASLKALVARFELGDEPEEAA